MIEVISVAEYAELIDDLDVEQTVMLDGRWPVSAGRHRGLGEVVLLHVGDVAALILPPAGGA